MVAESRSLASVLKRPLPECGGCSNTNSEVSNPKRLLSADAGGAHLRCSGPSRGVRRSLIAFDVDGTVLHQGCPDELERFRNGIGITLIRLASHGFRLAAITGNSLAQLSTRFVMVLIQELCARRALELLHEFHFFCNGAALYIHFDSTRCREFEDLLSRQHVLAPGQLHDEAMRCLLDVKGMVRSSYFVVRYVQQCCIPSDDADAIVKICNQEAHDWWHTVCEVGTFSPELKAQFYIATGEDEDADAAVRIQAAGDNVNTEASVFGPLRPGATPTASLRACVARDGLNYITSCNILPILSFRHARRRLLTRLEDPRMIVISRIKARLRSAGLVRYIVEPGGRATIDICHHLVNKRSALIWLLRRLGVEGVAQMGEPMGANAVYFGDEVVLNGNDIAVADVPGVLVFAVNDLIHRVPFRSNIELPTELTGETGPEATQAVLSNFADYVEGELQAKGAEPWLELSAVAAWKELRTMKRLESKCALFLRTVAAGPGTKLTYRRREAAAAALTALTRRGEGIDDLADSIIALANNIGMLGAIVRDQQFMPVQAQGFCLRHGIDSDNREDDLIEELGLTPPRPPSTRAHSARPLASNS